MDSNWAIVILTIVLVVVTGFYAFQTKRLADDTKRVADIMTRDYERKISPLIDLKIVMRGHRQSEYYLIVKLINYGFLPVKFDRLELHWWLFDRLSEVKIRKYEFKESLAPQGKEIEKEMFLADSEILEQRNDLKSKDNYLGIIHGLLHCKIKVFFLGRSFPALDVIESDPFKLV